MKALVVFILFLSVTVCAQEKDTIPTVNLNEFIIKDHRSIGSMVRMPDVKDNVIYAGKKSEVIQMERLNADLSTNNTRQVFAKVPGMSVWENDGSGIQVGVATRGLSPNRSWEFNVRQNGYDISSEVFGYPESYYSPPMEALDKIEVIRGAASLQYGPQFGGLLNYKIKTGDPNKILAFETQQTVGSYGLVNTYNALGGTYKKLAYYGFFHHRTADGWRNNSDYTTYTGYLSVNYQVSKKINLELNYTRMDYKSQQPGGLTDAQYNENHRQSFRERNWFGSPWNVASLLIKYDLSKSVNIQLRAFATIAERNSVGFTKAINVKDSINPATLQYNPRQVDRDNYQNYGTEARVSVKYTLAGTTHVVAGGIRAYLGNTERNQLGMGSTGDDFDLTLSNPTYARALNFSTTNYAAFVENIFYIGSRLKLVPGLRFDYIENKTEGYINTSQTGGLNPDTKIRQLLLYGLGAEFMLSAKTNLYANYSRAYRPVTFSELTPSATSEIIDPNLKDASGFNLDFGYRGSVKNFLSFDVGLFYLHYDNRIGTLSQNGAPFKTNIGTSVSKGIETYIEIDIVKMLAPKSAFGSLCLFSSNAFIDAKYVKWNASIENKKVENAPQHIHRLGATYLLKGFSATLQLSSVSEVFTDAVNTDAPNATGTIGKLSGYQVMDFSFSYKFMKHFNIKAGVNNLADQKYATRRATGYPGPGIMPANGRSFFVSVGASF